MNKVVRGFDNHTSPRCNWLPLFFLTSTQIWRQSGPSGQFSRSDARTSYLRAHKVYQRQDM